MSEQTNSEQIDLRKIAGNDTARIRILMLFLNNPNKKFYPGEIVDRASIGRNAWYDHQEDLIKMGFINELEKVGRSPYYRLNRENPIVNLLQAIQKFNSTS